MSQTNAVVKKLQLTVERSKEALMPAPDQSMLAVIAVVDTSIPTMPAMSIIKLPRQAKYTTYVRLMARLEIEVERAKESIIQIMSGGSYEGWSEEAKRVRLSMDIEKDANHAELF